MIDEKLVKGALSRWLIDIGYSQSMASELVNGNRRPSLSMAAKVETKYGIPAASWNTGPPLNECWKQLKMRAN